MTSPNLRKDRREVTGLPVPGHCRQRRTGGAGIPANRCARAPNQDPAGRENTPPGGRRVFGIPTRPSSAARGAHLRAQPRVGRLTGALGRRGPPVMNGAGTPVWSPLCAKSMYAADWAWMQGAPGRLMTVERKTPLPTLVKPGMPPTPQTQADTHSGGMIRLSTKTLVSQLPTATWS